MNVNRFLRYQGGMPINSLIKAEVAVIGCGAVGRNLVRQLATMGIGSIHVVDFDKVSDENLGCQGWAPEEIGATKVEAMRAAVKRLNPDCNLFADVNKFQANMVEDVDYVFCCVDNMEVRMEVFEASKHKRLFVEARMGMETGRVFYVTNADKVSAKYWLKEWFPGHEGEPDKCSEKATIYCADFVASMMVSGFIRCIKEQMLPLVVDLNIPAFTAVSTWAFQLPAVKEPLGPEEIMKKAAGFIVKAEYEEGEYYCEYVPCGLDGEKGEYIEGGGYSLENYGVNGAFCSPLCAAKYVLKHAEHDHEWMSAESKKLFTREDLGISPEGVDQAFPEFSDKHGENFFPPTAEVALRSVIAEVEADPIGDSDDDDTEDDPDF